MLTEGRHLSRGEWRRVFQMNNMKDREGDLIGVAFPLLGVTYIPRLRRTLSVVMEGVPRLILSSIFVARVTSFLCVFDGVS